VPENEHNFLKIGLVFYTTRPYLHASVKYTQCLEETLLGRDEMEVFLQLGLNCAVASATSESVYIVVEVGGFAETQSIEVSAVERGAFKTAWYSGT
jgi:hypothetical protein